jgi:cation:H+ antiporter
MSLILLWIAYVVLAGVIMNSGSRLVKDAEIIADKTRLGGTLVGVVLLSVVTSLPELFNGVGAILLAGQPDLTIGDIVGSLLVNLLIFGGVILLLKKGQWNELGTPSLIASGLFSALLTGLYVVAHTTASKRSDFDIGGIGWYSILIPVLYGAAIYLLYKIDKNSRDELHEDPLPTQMTLGQATRGFIINSLIVVAAGTVLPLVAGKIAVLSGLTNSFMGFIFLAIATSLPELVVVFQAVRLGLIHMALGDVFGSNLFDIAIIPIVDILYRKGSILAYASPSLIVGGLVSILMTLVVVFFLKFGKGKLEWFSMKFVSLSLFALYGLAVFLMMKG